MTKHRDLAYGDRLPESLLDALAEYVSTGIFNFRLTLASATSVQVVAGTGNAQVGVAVSGRWRYNSATVNAAHPGGAAGQYDVFVTASDNSFALGPPEVDNTVYTFGLQILAQGNTPGTALSRKVGETTWSGSAITALSLTADSYASASPTLVQAVPSGVISQYAGATAPAGYLLCNGAAVSRTTYAALFAAIGTTYGVGDGSTTFGLPDLRGRIAVGYDASQTEFDTLGETGGAKTVTLAMNQMPAHSHRSDGVGGTGGLTGGTTTNSGTITAGVAITGATGADSPDHAHGVIIDGAGAHQHGPSPDILGSPNFAYTDGTSFTHTAGGNTKINTTGVSPITGFAGAHGHTVNSGTGSSGGRNTTHTHTAGTLVTPALTVPGLTVPPMSISANGGSTPVSLLQPYITVNNIIKT